MNNILKYLSLVKFSHSIFAIPFAMVSFFGSITLYGSTFSLYKLCMVLLAMVLARNTAMAYNRYADRDIDIKNPRTAKREIPSGVIKKRNAIIFIIINAISFIAVSYFINNLCFYLSPVALLVIISYSHFKRFSSLCHIVLGLALSIAPVGASVAIMGTISNLSLYLAGVVVLWVSGFDILYSLQDREFDCENRLKSIPTLLGIKWSLIVSALLHLGAIVGVFIIGVQYSMNIIYYIGAAIFSLILIWEHIIVTPNNLSRVNLAFATLNGLASIIYALSTIAAMVL